MRNWLIYEPPGGAQPTLEGVEAFVTVREGFSKFAFLVPLVWLVWRRCWAALVVYALVEIALAIVVQWAGVGGGSAVVLAFLPNLALGLEAAWLRARSLERRGYRLVGSTLARTQEEAEAHFFHEWLGETTRERTSSVRDGGGYRAQPSMVLGLFPQPGGAR
ncbi:DUF2628 domain-containing protein [Hansschlegelia sp.]|uniref:DUF2628 domain-containing protein n=1 Tax=Hansschlegelia sp. TaxID=2041892 RepID=UPI002C78FE7F|nr:DUF2628 domain-containing protein [Hansschlegelia sp.]HVI29689.1 DUF2628 domain-containing protein [Hansschlegelia sp.]